jgi:hypothetical protein
VGGVDNISNCFNSTHLPYLSSNPINVKICIVLCFVLFQIYVHKSLIILKFCNPKQTFIAFMHIVLDYQIFIFQNIKIVANSIELTRKRLKDDQSHSTSKRNYYNQR